MNEEAAMLDAIAQRIEARITEIKSAWSPEEPRIVQQVRALTRAVQGISQATAALKELER